MAAKDTQDDTEELRAFREQWRAEVKQKRTHDHQEDERPRLGGPLVDSERSRPPLPARGAPTQAVPREPYNKQSPVVSVRRPLPLDQDVETPFQAAQRRALDVYREAVRHEQAGELDLALRLYRQAFRLDSNVDRAFHREEQALLASGPTTGPGSVTAGEANKPVVQHTRTVSAEKGGASDIAEGMKTIKLSSGIGAHQIHADRIVSVVLAKLVEEFSHGLSFSPEIENNPVFLESIPEELLVSILGYLDPSALERFAAVSKKARVVTLDSSLWRCVCTWRCGVLSSDPLGLWSKQFTSHRK